MKKTGRIVVMLIALCVVVLPLALSACDRGDAHRKEGYVYVTYDYDGAEAAVTEEYVQKGAVLTLPTPEKAGYAFIGWRCDDCYTVRDSVSVGQDDEMSLKAVFERDYTVLDAPCALFYDGAYHCFYATSYPEIGKKVTDIYVSEDYKVVTYSRKNYKGTRNVLAYKASFNGKIGSMQVKKIDAETLSFDAQTDDVTAELLQRYAPRLYWAKGETFWACDADAALAYMTRAKSDRGYYLEVAGIVDPDYENAFLHGDMTTAKGYGFAVEKEGKYLDLCYFVYCPYNKGKTILGTCYGNHVGDWEHVSVRLLRKNTESGVTFKPILVEYSTHSFRFYVPFDEAEKADGTHPVGYVAKESHGIWKEEGTHPYIVRAVFRLKDVCNKGTAWDLWKNDALETYVYDARTWQGKGVGNSVWKSCFDKNYRDPNSDSVYRWGNAGLDAGVFYQRFCDGPSGPQEKDNLMNYYTINSAQTL